MTAQVYKSTATRDVKSNVNAVYAFGRNEALHGQPVDAGGYALFVLRDRFVGAGGDLHRTWELVAKDLPYADAVSLMNKRVHHTAYVEAA